MLFKILHGDSMRLSTDITPLNTGCMYVTYDGQLYVDLNVGTDEAPDHQRVKLNSRPQNIRGTHSEFEESNSVFLNGEMIIVDDDVSGTRIKFGDGINKYSSLPFYGSIYSEKPTYTYAEIAGLTEQLLELQAQIDAIPVVPSGMIMIWSGSVDNIPFGWALCNGDNGTPNLTDKFVLGAGSSYAVGSIGGEEEHILTTEELAAHSHTFANNILVNTTATNGFTVGQATNKEYTRIAAISNTQSAGGGVAHNNMPPYYSLCYIMKL